MAQALPQNVRWLKIAVIVMGLALIVGTAVVAVTILRRLSVPSALAHFDITLPADAQVLESSTERGHLVLRVKSGELEELRIFDLATGQELNRIRLMRTP